MFAENKVVETYDVEAAVFRVKSTVHEWSRGFEPTCRKELLAAYSAGLARIYTTKESRNDKVITDEIVTDEQTPKELIASRLMDVWVAEKGPIPWQKMLRLMVIVKAMTQEEVDNLNELYGK